MGLGTYFKAKKPDKRDEAPRERDMEKAIAMSPTGNGSNMELQPPNSRFASSSNSLSNRSTASSKSDAYMAEIKHEVMVNFMYQQQCARVWVSDGSGELEGVLLRKSRGLYMACPPSLIDSEFAACIRSMNLQVSRMLCRLRPENN